MRTPASQRAGFTLAEVVITIALVAIVLISGLAGLNNVKFQAAYSRDSKIARELAKYSLGQVAAGSFEDDLEDYMSGDYADLDYPQFTWELTLGDEEFSDPEDEDGYDQPFDSWNPYGANDDEDDDEDAEEPYEVVRVKVAFEAPGDRTGEVILERWFSWETVYGTDEEDDA